MSRGSSRYETHNTLGYCLKIEKPRRSYVKFKFKNCKKDVPGKCKGVLTVPLASQTESLKILQEKVPKGFRQGPRSWRNSVRTFTAKAAAPQVSLSLRPWYPSASSVNLQTSSNQIYLRIVFAFSSCVSIRHVLG